MLKSFFLKLELVCLVHNKSGFSTSHDFLSSSSFFLLLVKNGSQSYKTQILGKIQVNGTFKDYLWHFERIL